MWALGSSKKLPSYIYDKIIIIIYVTSVGFFFCLQDKIADRLGVAYLLRQ